MEWTRTEQMQATHRGIAYVCNKTEQGRSQGPVPFAIAVSFPENFKNFQAECNLPTAPQCQFPTSVFQVSKAIVQFVRSSFTGMAIYGASQLMKFGCAPQARMAFIAETFIREGGRKV